MGTRCIVPVCRMTWMPPVLSNGVGGSGWVLWGSAAGDGVAVGPLPGRLCGRLVPGEQAQDELAQRLCTLPVRPSHDRVQLLGGVVAVADRGVLLCAHLSIPHHLSSSLTKEYVDLFVSTNDN